MEVLNGLHGPTVDGLDVLQGLLSGGATAGHVVPHKLRGQGAKGGHWVDLAHSTFGRGRALAIRNYAVEPQESSPKVWQAGELLLCEAFAQCSEVLELLAGFRGHIILHTCAQVQLRKQRKERPTRPDHNSPRHFSEKVQQRHMMP